MTTPAGSFEAASTTTAGRAWFGPTSPPLTLLAGPPGSGRTRALKGLHGDLVAAGQMVHSLRFTTDGVVTSAPSIPRETEPARRRATMQPGPRAGAHGDVEVARRAANTVASPLLSTPGSVLLVDDVQWADLDALAVLEALMHRLRGSAARCVLAVRTPGPPSLRAAGVELLARLRREGLATVARVAPLTVEEIARFVRAGVEGVPSRQLMAVVRADSRGVASAVHDTISSLTTGGVVHVVDRHAYLVPSTREANVRQDHLVASLRRAGPEVWTAAKAVAVLHPLGAATPRVLAEALGCTAERAEEHLLTLRAAGFVHRGRQGCSWRYLVPAVAVALRASCGPFERRRLGAVAVDAIWEGRVRCDDSTFLTERVAEAGNLVRPGWARVELMTRATAALTVDPRDAVRWWRAVSLIAVDRHQYAMASWLESLARFVDGDYDGCLQRIRILLDESADHLPVEARHEARVMQVWALHSVGDVARVEAIAAAPPDPTDDGVAALCRAIALLLLDRWSQARRQLQETRGAWMTTTFTTAMGDLLEMLADVFCGSPEASRARPVSHRRTRSSSERERRSLTNTRVSALLCLGDLRRCEELLTTERFPEKALLPSSRATLGLLRGEPDDGGDDLLDAARHTIATGTVHGFDPGRAILTQAATHILVGQGRLTTAREMLVRARAEGTALAHLLETPEVRIDRLLHRRGRAEQRVRAALLATTERGVVAGTDVLRALLIGLRLDAGDVAGAHEHLVALEQIQRVLPAARTEMLIAQIRATIHRDIGAAEETIAIARARGVPWDLATTQLRLVGLGLGDPAQLLEAYVTFEKYDALLYRAWVRNAMTAYGLAVPGRRKTVIENERLLSILVAEGLPNRQIARTLDASEKSVEGRLSRLFARTGHQSRVELTRAVQCGDLMT